jgi:zinc protease
MNSIKIAVSFVAMLFLAYAAFAQDYESIDIPKLQFTPPSVERFELENGIVVHFYEDHSLPVVTVDALIKLGEIYVPDEKAGLAEICGTVLRTGGTMSTPSDEFDEDLDFVGASLESGAGTESGQIQLKVLRKDIELGLQHMAEMLSEPAFEQEKLDVAIENRIEAIRRENDNPHNIARREFYKLLFPGHPYGRTPTVESVSNLTRDDFVNYHSQFYGPDGCIMAVSGDLTLDETRSLVQKFFGEWKNPNLISHERPAVPAAKPGVYYVYRDMNQTYFRIGHQGVSLSNPDRNKIEVMNFILGGGGFVSRLTNAVRVQAGLAYSVWSSFYQMDMSGSFFCDCQTKSETTAEAAEMVLAELRKIIDGGVTQDELETAQNSLINTEIFEYSTPQRIAYQQASFEFNGYPPDYATKRIEEIRSITVDDVKQIAKKYLKPDSVVFIAVGNQELFDKSLSTFGSVSEISL